MMIHYRKAPYRDRDPEDLYKFFESVFDPGFPVVGLFAEQGRAADTSGHAVVPAGYRRFNQLRAGRLSSGDLRGCRNSVRKNSIPRRDRSAGTFSILLTAAGLVTLAGRKNQTMRCMCFALTAIP